MDSGHRVRWGRVVLVALAGVVSHTFGRATVGVLLPAMAEDLGLSDTFAGALASVNLGCYLAGVVAVMALAGRFEPFTLLRAGIAVVTAGLAVLATANSPAAVAVGTGLGGLGGASIWLTAPTIATEGVPAQRRGAVLGSLTATMGAVLVVVPLVTDLLRNLTDDNTLWRPVWVAELAASALLLVLLSGLVKSAPTERLVAGRKWGALTAISGWRRTLVAYMAFAWTANAFAQFMGLALERQHGFSRSSATLLFSAMGGASLVGAMLFGRLSDALGRPATMALVMAVVAAAAVAFPFGGPTLVVAAVVAYGGASFAYPALTAAWVREHVADRTFTAVFATMTLFYGPASAVSPLVGGQLIDRTGSYSATYVLIAAMAVLATVLMASLAVRRPRGAAG